MVLGSSGFGIRCCFGGVAGFGGASCDTDCACVSCGASVVAGDGRGGVVRRGGVRGVSMAGELSGDAFGFLSRGGVFMGLLLIFLRFGDVVFPLLFTTMSSKSKVVSESSSWSSPSLSSSSSVAR